MTLNHSLKRFEPTKASDNGDLRQMSEGLKQTSSIGSMGNRRENSKSSLSDVTRREDMTETFNN